MVTSGFYGNPSTGNIGNLYWEALNSLGNQAIFAGIVGGVTSKNSGAENGYLNFTTYQSGANTTAMQINDIGGVSIGSSYAVYAGTSTAPSNGLIVQGSVGIGTNSPFAALDVNGAIDIRGLNGVSLPAADSGLNSVAIGPGALANLALGGSAAYKNTAVGVGALANIQFSTGTANTAVGYGALGTAGAAGSNTGIGYLSMQNATSGGANTAVGVTSLFSVGGGGSNVAMGYAALRNVTGSSGNIGIGAGAGATTSGGGITTGANNIVIGPNVASTTLNTGSNNILIGGSSAVDTPSPGTSNFLNIGNLIYGISIGTATAPGNVGIGTTAPLNKLDVAGGHVIGAGYVGTTTAPANGLIVQGNVGIGTQSSSALLSVGATGNLAVDSSGNITTTGSISAQASNQFVQVTGTNGIIVSGSLVSMQMATADSKPWSIRQPPPR